MPRVGTKHWSHEYETSIEVMRGEESVEVEVLMVYDVSSPEPDVGLFGYGVDDCDFVLPNYQPLPDDVQAAIDADETWRERQAEKAIEDFEPYDPPDFD